MKKALKINLSGQIFHIDDDAYEKLKIYLDTISSHFSNTEESKEIISDIETRIAELFSERMKDGNQVITIRNVEEIIDIMGKPEEIINDDDEEPNHSTGRKKTNRRLYRDPENAVIGGVSSGLGAYFNIDTLIIRILFIVLVLVGAGFPVLLYLILWIAVPKARTTAERLEMRGEKVTVSNIERTVKEEYESVKENFKKAKDSDAYRRTENFFEEFFSVLGRVILVLLKVVLVFIGIIFAIAGIGLLIGILAFLFFGVHYFPMDVFHSMKFDFITPFISPGNFSLLAISLTMLVLIPVLSIVYGLFKAIFRFRAKDRALGMSAFALWVLALVAAISLIVSEAKNFSESESLSNTTVLSSLESNTLTLSMENAEGEFTKRRESFSIDDNRYYFEKEGVIYGKATVDIETSGSSYFEIRIAKGSRGMDEQAAALSAETVSYKYALRGSNLALSSYFSIPEGEKWRLQYVKLTVYVPAGDSLVIDESLKDHLEEVDNTAGFSSWRMAGNTWVMGEEGLEIVKKKGGDEL